jgi:hypothetical protein
MEIASYQQSHQERLKQKSYASPQRSKSSKADKKTEIVSAKRTHVGMMDIIDHIGRVPGIDAAVYSSTDTGTAQKIISLARYLLATNGQSFPGIQTSKDKP